MNTDLFIIELLSAKKEIIQHYKKNYQRILVLSFIYFTLTAAFFFGLATLVYHFLKNTVQNFVYLDRFKNLYHLSFGIGCFFSLIFLLVLAIFLLKRFSLVYQFNHWLENHSLKFLERSPVRQDDDHYYLSTSKTAKQIAIKKKTCQLLTTTIDGEPIMIGQTPLILDIYLTKIFVLHEEPETVADPIKKNLSWNKKILLTLVCCFLLGFMGVYHYAARTATLAEISAELKQEGAIQTQSSSETTQKNTDGLIKQTGTAPTYQTEIVNDLYLDQETNELYMTTDSGKNWSFIPIKSDWLRSGDYTLTSGEVPVGYWMDKTYEVSADFSWFIFSSDDEAFYLLTSTNNGKTWRKNIIDENLGRIRYRKATFFKNGSGVAIFSAPGGMSAEGISIYTTINQGKTWNRDDGTSISQPIQNASFISQSTGFIATRTTLYYTTDYSRTFNESLINIPEGYSSDGLNIFETPNEVIEASSNVLETKFNLLKTGDIDIGKMFSCLFKSEDGGATWTFEKQLAQIEPD